MWAIRKQSRNRGRRPRNPATISPPERRRPDSADYENRNVIERGFCRFKQWRGLATRYDELAIVHSAAVVVSVVTAWTKRSADLA